MVTLTRLLTLALAYQLWTDAAASKVHRLSKIKATAMAPTQFHGVYKPRDETRSGSSAPPARVTAEEQAADASFIEVTSDGVQIMYRLDPGEVHTLLESAKGVRGEWTKAADPPVACEECKGPSDENEHAPPPSGKSCWRNALAAAILGADQRWEVPFANWAPTTQTGLFEQNARGGHCSGVLVGPRYVMVAARCVHEGPGDWIRGGRFYPGRTSASVPPYTSYTWRRAIVPVAWTNRGDIDYDFALLSLAAEPNLGWIGMGWSSEISATWFMHHKGYPSDKPVGSMWSTSGRLSDVREFTLMSDTTDVKRSNAGGPWYRYEDGKPVIYAVQSGSTTWWTPTGWQTENRHTRITSLRYGFMCWWMRDARVC